MHSILILHLYNFNKLLMKVCDSRKSLSNSLKLALNQKNRKMSGINPIQNSRNIDRHVYLAERFLILIVAFYGSVLAFKFVWIMAEQYTDLTAVKTVVAIAAAAVAAFVTDFAFRNFLTESVFWPFAIFHPDVRGQITGGDYFFSTMRFLKWLVITGIVGGLFWLDWGTMQNSRDPIAGAAGGVEQKDIAGETARLNGEMSATLAPLKSRIEGLKKEIELDKKAVERKNPKLITMIREQDHGWAKKEIARLQASATKKKSGELEKLEIQYNERVGEATGAITATAAALGVQNGNISTQNAALQASISSTIFLYSGWLKILTVFCRVFLVLSFLSKPSNSLDVNGDGRIDGKDVTAAALGGEPQPDFT